MTVWCAEASVHAPATLRQASVDRIGRATGGPTAFILNETLPHIDRGSRATTSGWV
jgi:hypothetical protein